MGLGHGNNHRRPKNRMPRRPQGAGSKRRKPSSIKASSSFSSVVPSRGSITIREEHREGVAECGGFLWAMLGVFALVLLGGGHYACALGFSLVLPGLALFLRPPTRGLGKWMDIGVVGLLATLLFAFVPLFYWKDPAWRTAAVEVFDLDLPVLLSVQPWVSFEAFVSAVAGFGWLYAAGSWKVNYAGRRKIYFITVCLISVFAVIVALGTYYGWRYPGAKDAPVFSFFPNRNQTANFIALGGVFAFGYAMEGLRGRKMRHAIGLLGSVLCLMALVQGVSRAGVLLYFGGIILWLILSMRRGVFSLFFKIGIPLVLLIFSFLITSHESAIERVSGTLSSPFGGGENYRVLIFRDAWEMIEDSPLTGVGLGNFSAVFPQYRDLSRNSHDALHPESDLLWLGAEGGLIAVLFFGIFLGAYLWKCRAAGGGKNGAYRIIALTCVVMFLLHGLFDVSGHRPGTAYFAILIAALSLPRGASSPPILKPRAWRYIGGGLMCVGALWMIGGLFGLSTHSTVAIELKEERAVESGLWGELDQADQAVNEWIDWQPLNWRAYFQRAQIALSRGGDLSLAEQDFRRARFVEPNIGMVAYEEGNAWLAYDVKRTVSAWREALTRYVDSKDRLYDSMLRKAGKDEALLEGMIEMTRVNSVYRARLMLYLSNELFNREIEAELSADPSLQRFTIEQRTAIVRRWIRYGEHGRLEAYLDEFGGTLNSPWFFSSILLSNQSRDAEAVEVIRGALEVAELPEVEVDINRIDRLKRGFFMASADDLATGTGLLSYYLEQGDAYEALLVVDKLLKSSNPPAYLYFWRGEILYQLKDYSESWYAYEAYIERLNSK